MCFVEWCRLMFVDCVVLCWLLFVVCRVVCCVSFLGNVVLVV